METLGGGTRFDMELDWSSGSQFTSALTHNIWPDSFELDPVESKTSELSASWHGIQELFIKYLLDAHGRMMTWLGKSQAVEWDQYTCNTSSNTLTDGWWKIILLRRWMPQKGPNSTSQNSDLNLYLHMGQESWPPWFHTQYQTDILGSFNVCIRDVCLGCYSMFLECWCVFEWFRIWPGCPALCLVCPPELSSSELSLRWSCVVEVPTSTRATTGLCAAFLWSSCSWSSDVPTSMSRWLVCTSVPWKEAVYHHSLIWVKSSTHNLWFQTQK